VPSPFDIIDNIGTGYPIWEVVSTNLPNGGEVESGVIDLIDMLPVRRGSDAGGAGQFYQYAPSGGVDARSTITYSVFAEGAASAIAPIDVVILGAQIDPNTGLIAANPLHVSKHLHFAGAPIDFTLGAGVNERASHTGSFHLDARTVQIFIWSRAITVTLLRAGFYLRPW
jgi:hypothetical protein